MSEQFGYIDLNTVLNTCRILGLIDLLSTTTMITRLKHGKSSSFKSVILHSENKNNALKKIFNHVESLGYITHPTQSKNFYIAIKDYENKFIYSFISFEIEDNTINAKFRGDLEECIKMKEWFQSTFNSLGTKMFVAEAVDRNLIEYQNTYMSDDSVSLASQSFYPWLSVDLNEYFKSFMESEEPILVMFGPPGTGKSTFLRSLIVSGKYTTTLAYIKEAVESPKLISDFYSGDSTILAYEDIDNYLKSREDGNLLMSTLLNASEGVIKKKKKKIVFSTNLPTIDRIDPALLRKGRCFDILEFRELTPLEAAKAALDVGVPQKDWSLQKSWSLAQTLSRENESQQSINRFAKKVGFF